MRKLIFIFLFVVIKTNAQSSEFGIRTGVNVSRFTGDVVTHSSRVGFIIGVFSEFKISDKFSFQPEILFASQGVNEKNLINEKEFILSYINVPLMTKYLINNKFSLEAGPQLGFLLSSSAYDGFELIEVKGFDNSDFALNFGAHFNVSKRFSIGLRYSIGLANIISDVNNKTAKVHSSNLTQTLLYKF